ncbi:MAG: hypothetical protein JWM11_1004, partial [Planctomycetaceae bacterium]|nr:hypothetical protein [Planctomycetaceae bacterium]
MSQARHLCWIGIVGLGLWGQLFAEDQPGKPAPEL